MWSRHRDPHIAAQGVEETKQPFGRKAIEAAVEQCGNLGLGDAQKLAGGGLGQSSASNDCPLRGSVTFRQARATKVHTPSVSPS